MTPGGGRGRSISTLARNGSKEEKMSAIALHRELLLREEVNRLENQMERLSTLAKLLPPPPCDGDC